MFKNYYVNKDANFNPDLNHEVHTSDCPYLPPILKSEYLGYFSCSSEAIKEARKKYVNVVCCASCCVDSQVD